MTDATISAHQWLGFWKIDAPLTNAQYEEDRVILGQLMTPVPEGATLKRVEVWVNGRSYYWENLDVTPMGYKP
jgi:hypothetical protein